jgi:hypothetical protein
VIDIWKHFKGKKTVCDFMALRENIDTVMTRLNGTGIKTRLLISDLQNQIDEENINEDSSDDDDGFRAGKITKKN